jgi:hypothetical protein
MIAAEGGFSRLLELVGAALSRLASAEGQRPIACVLATTFAVSGYAKLRRPAEPAIAMVDFGVLRRVSTSIGVALGIAEAGLAAGLAAGLIAGGATLLVASTLAAALLWLFVVLIGRALSRGDDFACACFGETSGGISKQTLARATALALLASFLGAGALSLPAASAELSVVYEGTIGLGLFACAALLGTVPRLLRWNDDPFGVRADAAEAAP